MYGGFTYGGGYYGQAAQDASAPVSTNPGGGGYGHAMPESHFKRYKPAYGKPLRKSPY